MNKLNRIEFYSLEFYLIGKVKQIKKSFRQLIILNFMRIGTNKAKTKWNIL